MPYFGGVQTTGHATGRPPGPGAWRWSARGDAIYWSSRDTVDRRLMGWKRYPVNPATGRTDAEETPILLRESSQVGRFDVADATGDMVVELSNRSYVVSLLTLERGQYVSHRLRTGTLPVFASFMPNGQEIALGTVEGDSTLTVSRIDPTTGRETPLGRVAWGIAGQFELAFPVRADEFGRILLNRPNFDTRRTDVLRFTVDGKIDTVARLGSLTEVFPLGAGSVVYLDLPMRFVRVWPNGSADTLTLPDSMRHPTFASERWGDDGLVVFLDDDDTQYHAIWTIDWRPRRYTYVTKVPFDDGLIGLQVVGDTVFTALQSVAGHGVELLAVPLRGAKHPRVVASLPTGRLEYPFLQISPDRKRVLVIGTEDFSDIWLVKGALARRR